MVKDEILESNNLLNRRFEIGAEFETKKATIEVAFLNLVPREGLEPPRLRTRS